MKHNTTETERAFAAGEFNSQERARRFAHKIERERDELREAIQEAAEVFYTFNDVGNCRAFHDAKDKALDKIKPFLA